MAQDEQREKRKRKQELLASPKPAAKQTKLQISPARSLTDDVVDDIWGRAFFGLDIAPNKSNNDLFREAITATKRSQPGYKGPSRHKLLGPVLERLYTKCME